MADNIQPNQPDITNDNTIEFVQNNPATTTHLPCPGSSWLESFSYDSSSLRLTVTTKKGDSWQIAQFYPNSFEELQLSPSKGSHYTTNIKGKHITVKIHKTPKLEDFPKNKGEAHVKIKNRFTNPTNDRYKHGRYPEI